MYSETFFIVEVLFQNVFFYVLIFSYHFPINVNLEEYLTSLNILYMLKIFSLDILLVQAPFIMLCFTHELSFLYDLLLILCSK